MSLKMSAMKITSLTMRVHSTIVKAFATCSLIALLALPVLAQTPIAATPNPATIPTDLSNQPWWAARHKAVVEAAQEPSGHAVAVDRRFHHQQLRQS